MSATAHPLYQLTAIILTGYYRSGKGTQAQRLAAHPIGFQHFDMGRALKKRLELEPTNKELEPVREGKPASSRIAIWTFKKWLMTTISKVPNESRRRLVLDGIPRKPDQLEPVITFLKERGYQHIVGIHFSTSPDICDARPARPGRPEDTDPGLQANRRVFYDETLEMIRRYRIHGISQSMETFHMIDTDGQSEEQTHLNIMDLLGYHNIPKPAFRLPTPTREISNGSTVHLQQL